MGYSNETQLIKYEEFIKEMLPKSSSMIIEQQKLRKIKSQNSLKFRNGESLKKQKKAWMIFFSLYEGLDSMNRTLDEIIDVLKKILDFPASLRIQVK